MGMLVGIIASAPVGPVNVLCIQRTIERGYFAGLASGIGAMLGDGLIAAFAAFGVHAISDAMQQHKGVLQLIGGAILLVFAVNVYRTPPALDPEATARDGRERGLWFYVWSIPQTFFLTITNPGAVFGVIAIVGGAGSALGGLHSTTETIALVLSVMAGSFLWWFVIARGVATVRHRLDQRHLRALNQAAGIVLGLFGLGVLGQLGLRTFWA
jgi:threonine/homoserine/homoserine lactone efflux protein